MHKHTNHLIHESSPYLLQHAHNPVDWNPWSDGALSRAKTENKPILVSIGYAACHWCHVMERESFEDEVTAAFMNKHFINIKIDREERPDLDHIYMDAVQAMTGSGGWPLNVFLTPEGKPFYGGTYFPPRRAFNRASWMEVLQGVVQSFKEKRHEVDAQAENLTQHLLQSNAFGLKETDPAEVFVQQKQEEAFQHIMKSADKEWGGFGQAPKFPQTFTIQFLLRYSHVNRKLSPENAAAALQQATLSLDKMIDGGIYDQLGGGFARYSTDSEWLAPHFEKMLYDNALLVIVLGEAYQLTGKERYREAIEETLSFAVRDLMHPEKGFYAALDADSEGEEGKFYVWDKIEVDNILGNDAAAFCGYYNITNQGNWEGKNILHVKQTVADYAIGLNMDKDQLTALLKRGVIALKQCRDQRPKPLLDDKIILGWNALMNTALCKAFEATGKPEYKLMAIDNMQFLLEKFNAGGQNEFYHTWKNDKGRYPAFLDDYAFLIQALIRLHEITADTRWLNRAKDLAEYVINHFSEPGTGFFYYTRKDQQDVIIRKKEVYDGAVPSGNSVMAYNLYRLSVYFDLGDWREASYKAVSSLAGVISRYPGSFGIWNCLLMEILEGTHEIAILGKDAFATHQKLLKEYIPHLILMASISGDNTFPLLRDKETTDPVSIYLCKNFACQKPVDTITALISLIDSDRTYI